MGRGNGSFGLLYQKVESLNLEQEGQPSTTQLDPVLNVNKCICGSTVNIHVYGSGIRVSAGP